MPTTAELNSSQPLLVQLLLEKEILTPEQVEVLNEARSKDHGSLESILVKKGLVMDQHIAEVYADYLMLPLFDMVPDEADPKLAGLLPEKLCREHLLVPVELHDDMLDVAFATFEDMLMVDELQLLTGLTIRPMIAPLSVVEKTLETLYRASRTKFVSQSEDYARRRTRNERTTDGDDAERGDSGHRRAAAARPRRPHRPHGEPDPRAGVAGGGQRHSHRAVRGFLRHPPAGGRLAPRAGRRRRDRSSCRSSPASRFWRKWTSPRNACPRTAPSP